MAETLRICGLVQGVGFRPMVWHLAQMLGLIGDVCNDGAGVLIRLWANTASIDQFCQQLQQNCPPLAHIDTLERTPLYDDPPKGIGFQIRASTTTPIYTNIIPDAATCPACQAEIFDLAQRRYRYPFTNCTHCGPRLSILHALPYDRAHTSMAAFTLCADCAAEYVNPLDRRFHAQPNACHICGPQLELVNNQGEKWPLAAGEDKIITTSRLLTQGRIIAIKGLGGFHLACDAESADVVMKLRQRKRRYAKPFALMARDINVIRNYCQVSDTEAALLASPAAPIVLLERRLAAAQVAIAVAPGQDTLGFMLPHTPLQHLLLQNWTRPLVMTSGNRSDEPPCIHNQEALQRLQDLAEIWLLHDREIVHRLDDSIVRVMAGAPRLLRRARGYAPTSLRSPPGFAAIPPILAVGGALKSTFCLLDRGRAILSQHLGDLEDARVAEDYEITLARYRTLFQHDPHILAVDAHPDYQSTRFGRIWAARAGLTLIKVQHHHAHIAAVLAEHAWPRERGPVLGLALDGLGYGTDGNLWGGEFFRVDYQQCQRLGSLAPISLPGGAAAIRTPWRSAYAHLAAHLGLDALQTRYPNLAITDFLQQQPLDLLNAMCASNLNAPLTSACGRLFDAVAAVLGVCREAISYEGQAAIELEVLARSASAETASYPFAQRQSGALRLLDPAPLWEALLGDLARGEDRAHLAMRFHRGLAHAVAALARDLALTAGVNTVVVAGGVLQNRLLFEGIAHALRKSDLNLLAPQQLPANDGGLAVGQAFIAAAQTLNTR